MLIMWPFPCFSRNWENWECLKWCWEHFLTTLLCSYVDYVTFSMPFKKLRKLSGCFCESKPPLEISTPARNSYLCDTVSWRPSWLTKSRMRNRTRFPCPPAEPPENLGATDPPRMLYGTGLLWILFLGRLKKLCRKCTEEIRAGNPQ